MATDDVPAWLRAALDGIDMSALEDPHADIRERIARDLFQTGAFQASRPLELHEPELIYLALALKSMLANDAWCQMVYVVNGQTYGQMGGKARELLERIQQHLGGHWEQRTKEQP